MAKNTVDVTDVGAASGTVSWNSRPSCWMVEQ